MQEWCYLAWLDLETHEQVSIQPVFSLAVVFFDICLFRLSAWCTFLLYVFNPIFQNILYIWSPRLIWQSGNLLVKDPLKQACKCPLWSTTVPPLPLGILRKDRGTALWIHGSTQSPFVNSSTFLSCRALGFTSKKPVDFYSYSW